MRLKNDLETVVVKFSSRENRENVSRSLSFVECSPWDIICFLADTARAMGYTPYMKPKGITVSIEGDGVKYRTIYVFCEVIDEFIDAIKHTLNQQSVINPVHISAESKESTMCVLEK